jgi:uncharacterized protein YggE
MKKKTVSACSCNHKIIFVLTIIFAIFLITLTAFTIVSIQNKIKQGKYIGQDFVTKDTITVTGTGEVYTQPDLAIITLSVKSEARTVIEAMTENTEKMNAVIDLIKAKNVDSKDLKTVSFNIYPRYEWQKEEVEIFPNTESKRVLVGYEITQSLQVKIRNLNKIGEIIQTATVAGINQVGALQFTIDNQDEFKKQAREEAIKEAKEKAKELSSQLGVKLLKITDFSEGGNIPRPLYYDTAFKEASGADSTPTPQIETGENKIQVSVSITFEIN